MNVYECRTQGADTYTYNLSWNFFLPVPLIETFILYYSIDFIYTLHNSQSLWDWLLFYYN